MVSMEPFAYHETKNIDEHNQIVSKINELVTDRNAADGQIDAVKQTADTALADADTARQTADDAKALATTADGKAAVNATNIAVNSTDISTLNGLMAYMNANAFVTVAFNKTATAITAVFSRKDGSTYSANLPIATTTTAGFMDSAMKQQLDANTNAIVVLQSQYPTIFVTFPSASPTQTEIQTVYDNYRTAYPAINLPAIPAQGFTMVDASNNVRVEYDKIAATWIFSPTGITKSTNATYGVIVGEENGADGSLYIVDGKALVNGFDALKARLTDAESAIAIRVTTDTFNAHTASTLHKSSTDITKLGALPLIASGDAGKVLTVKSDETGYENKVCGQSTTFHDYVETMPDVVSLMSNCSLGDQIMGVIFGSNEDICFSVTKINMADFVGVIVGKLGTDLQDGYKMSVQEGDIVVCDSRNSVHTFSSSGTYALIRVYAITDVYE